MEGKGTGSNSARCCVNEKEDLSQSPLKSMGVEGTLGLVALCPLSQKFSKTAEMKLNSSLIQTPSKFLGEKLSLLKTEIPTVSSMES